MKFGHNLFIKLPKSDRPILGFYIILLIVLFGGIWLLSKLN